MGWLEVGGFARQVGVVMTYVEARHAFVPTGRDEGCAECSFAQDSRIHRVVDAPDLLAETTPQDWSSYDVDPPLEQAVWMRGKVGD